MATWILKSALYKKDGTSPVIGVTLSETALILSAGQTATLTATVVPDDAGNKTVRWKSGDEKIATIDAEAKVTAIVKGTATITVTTKDGAKTATCTVTVNEQITMTTTTASGSEALYLAGTGRAVIDCGNGSAPKTVALSNIRRGINRCALVRPHLSGYNFPYHRHRQEKHHTSALS